MRTVPRKPGEPGVSHVAALAAPAELEDANASSLSALGGSPNAGKAGSAARCAGDLPSAPSATRLTSQGHVCMPARGSPSPCLTGRAAAAAAAAAAGRTGCWAEYTPFAGNTVFGGCRRCSRRKWWKISTSPAEHVLPEADGVSMRAAACRRGLNCSMAGSLLQQWVITASTTYVRA